MLRKALARRVIAETAGEVQAREQEQEDWPDYAFVARYAAREGDSDVTPPLIVQEDEVREIARLLAKVLARTCDELAAEGLIK